MADNHPALQYAHFRLKDKVGLPADLFVGTEECLLAATAVLPKPSLQKDYEVTKINLSIISMENSNY